MNYYEVAISFCVFILIYFTFRKFNILIDDINTSEHKKLADENKSPIILGGVFFSIILIFNFYNEYLFLKFIIFSLLILGLLSDKNLIPNPKIRFFIQTIILFSLVIVENLKVHTVSITFLDNLLKYELFNIFFTVFCFAILINGSNFLDGLNGILSGYCLLILCSLICIDIYSQQVEIENIEFIRFVFWLILIFFIFNIFGFVYLGDSGSYIISTIIGIILIEIYAKNLFISPYYIAVMLWYPAFENLFSLIRRIGNTKNISNADKLHLHQLIFRFLKSKKIFKPVILNSISGLLIVSLNIPSFIIATMYHFHTMTLVIILLFNVVIYLTLYFFLFKVFSK